MKKRQSSLDGFVPRRPVGISTKNASLTDTDKRPKLGQTQATRELGTTSKRRLIKTDIDDSLREIDADTPEAPKKRRFPLRRRKTKKPVSRRKKIIKRIVIALAVILVLIGAYVGIRAIIASNNIFNGNIFGLLQNQPLKMDANGRTNILVLGTTDDDPNHPGNYLTDTMMVISIDQNAKNAYMFSIPRDLYVDYGHACDSGYQGKINVYFSCANAGQNEAAEQDRLTKTQKFVGNIVGLDIQYGVHVNSVVVRDAVDAVGGVDVDVEGSNGAPGILDRNFDWGCNYTCYKVKYDNGVHHLSGEQAMYLSMARGDTAPTYGLANSNFDREKNQQKIIIALKEKATATGTITNIGKVTGLIDAMGKNLRTNFQTSEIRTLMSIGADVPQSSIHQISLNDAQNAVVTTGNIGGASVVQPAAGLYNYSEIQAFIKKQLSNNPVVREGANVAVFNGSGSAGVAQNAADSLEKKGFTVTTVSTAPEGTYSDVEIYQLGKGMTETKAKLESIYGVKVKDTPSPVTVSGDTDFVVIFGKAPSSKQQ